MGSGTTLLAAEQTDRICYGAEIEPKYVEVCIERFKAASDKPAIHIETGLTFEELKETRLKETKMEVIHVE